MDIYDEKKNYISRRHIKHQFAIVGDEDDLFFPMYGHL